MFGSGDLRNSTTFTEILHLFVLLVLAGAALNVLMQLVGLNPDSLIDW
jgi:hypothetical protein